MVLQPGHVWYLMIRALPRISFLLKKYGPNPASFCLFSSFPQYNDKYGTIFDYKSIDGVLLIRTRDCTMVGAEESNEL